MIIQFDLYTCGELDHLKVINHLTETFGITKIQWQYLDREEEFNLLDSSN
jgi:S-adenosylmethionine/arginine decarboxylase-like enzyme